MPLSLTESQSLSQIAGHLYSFLPGQPHPFADPSISFAGIAQRLGLARYWPGGSKLPAITQLLSGVLEYERGKFCQLIVEIVRASLKYRQGKEPLTREEIEGLNSFLLKVKFKIPEICETSFLDTLPRSAAKNDPKKSILPETLQALKKDFLALSSYLPQQRGYHFESFLGNLFAAYDLAPRSAFRLVGEQIDGSLQFQGQTYLIEARWRNQRSDQADLLVFSGKVGGKAQWSRGIFISYSGFTEEGLEGFGQGKPTNILCIDGLDLHHILDGGPDLRDVIEKKARTAAESNRAFVPVRELFPNII